jgi:predicted transcriptional regulator
MAAKVKPPTEAGPKEAGGAEQQRRLKRNEEKWTSELMEAGWTVVPSVLLERQRAFGLDAMDINILLLLAQYWWRSDNPPHPSKAAMAECMNVDRRTVQRRIARLEGEGLIQRQYRHSSKSGRQETNNYLFDGLIEKAKPLAQELIAIRQKRRQEDDARRRRGRARDRKG